MVSVAMRPCCACGAMALHLTSEALALSCMQPAQHELQLHVWRVVAHLDRLQVCNLGLHLVVGVLVQVHGIINRARQPALPEGLLRHDDCGCRCQC